MQPSIAWTGTGYLVAWGDARGGSMDIYGTMLAPDGTRTGSMQDVLLADTAGQASSPEIAATGDGGFVVVFEDCDSAGGTGNCSVQSVRVGADGSPQGGPVMVSPPVPVQRRPYVATGHGQTYVTFRDKVDAGGMQKTMARLTTLDAGGAATGPGVLVHMQSNGQYPHVAIGPSQVALVYQRENPSAEIVLALYDPDPEPAAGDRGPRRHGQQRHQSGGAVEHHPLGGGLGGRAHRRSRPSSPRWSTPRATPSPRSRPTTRTATGPPSLRAA